MTNQHLFNTLLELYDIPALESELDEIKRAIAMDRGEDMQAYDREPLMRETKR